MRVWTSAWFVEWKHFSLFLVLLFLYKSEVSVYIIWRNAFSKGKKRDWFPTLADVCYSLVFLKPMWTGFFFDIYMNRLICVVSFKRISHPLGLNDSILFDFQATLLANVILVLILGDTSLILLTNIGSLLDRNIGWCLIIASPCPCRYCKHWLFDARCDKQIIRLSFLAGAVS